MNALGRTLALGLLISFTILVPDSSCSIKGKLQEPVGYWHPEPLDDQVQEPLDDQVQEPLDDQQLQELLFPEVPPEVTLFPGKNRTAICEAIAGKPAAQIFWTPDGDCKTMNESHSNGTVTVRSTCHWEHKNVSAVFCFVSHSTGNKILSIQLSQGVTSMPNSLLIILYVKLSLLGIILLIVGFVFFQKRNYFRK